MTSAGQCQMQSKVLKTDFRWFLMMKHVITAATRKMLTLLMPLNFADELCDEQLMAAIMQHLEANIQHLVASIQHLVVIMYPFTSFNRHPSLQSSSQQT
jgi:hypothetical protein